MWGVAELLAIPFQVQPIKFCYLLAGLEMEWLAIIHFRHFPILLWHVMNNNFQGMDFSVICPAAKPVIVRSTSWCSVNSLINKTIILGMNYIFMLWDIFYCWNGKTVASLLILVFKSTVILAVLKTQKSHKKLTKVILV